MREPALAILRCPACRADGRWDMHVLEADEREIREADLVCQSCGVPRRVRSGIVDLMQDPPDYVSREAQGLELFAEFMLNEGWTRERVLRLPYEEDGYWYAQARAIEQVLDGDAPGVEIAPGRRVLDVGSNTCWASAMLADRGLDVVALDIVTHEMQGLRTADWWFAARGVYFERVVSVMFDPALASGAFDLVWCSEVLHHNHPENLDRTMRELHRLLKPGGQVIVVNEPVRALRSPKWHPGAEVAMFEGHEHAFLRRRYLAAARRAGFEIALFAPPDRPMLGAEAFGVTPAMSTLTGFRVAVAHGLRRNRLFRAAYLAWLNYVTGISLQMVCTKPL